MYTLIADYGAQAVALVLTGLGLVLTKLVLVKIESAWLHDVITRAWMEVRSAVLEVGQTYVDAIKEGRADGKLTDFEKGEAKAKAIAIAKSNIGKKGLKRLAKIFDVEEWIANKIETVVRDSKPAAPTAPPAVLPPSA